MSKDILILIMPFIISAGQVLFKIASREVAAFDHNSLLKLSVNAYFIFALILYGVATLLWVYILKHFPLMRLKEYGRKTIFAVHLIYCVCGTSRLKNGY